MCIGGDCVQSLTISPLTLTETPCAVTVGPIAADLPHTWGTVARSCRGLLSASCAHPSEICVPAVEPGFAQCLVHDGVWECPDTYSVKHVLYHGLKDTRACSPCACGAPTGGNCSAAVLVFNDAACSAPILGGSYGIDASGPACIDILPSGPALGSKLATAPVYSPGVCQASGGEPTGQATPDQPSTYCCLP
jgi:hypothetical protein